MKYGDVHSFEGTASRTSTGLVRRAKADDAEAWVQLVELYSRRVYRWCRRAGLQPSDAADVVQEVLRSVARKLGDFNHEREGATFRGWLRRITQNKLRDHYRRSSRTADRPAGGTDAHQRLMNCKDSGLPDSPPAPDGPVAVRGQFSQIDPEELERARMEFTNRDWHCFWRVVVDGQSAAEAGSEFGMSGNAVRIVKMRVLRRLRETLTLAPRTGMETEDLS